MHILLAVVGWAVAGSLLFGLVWAAIGWRLNGGPEERRRQLLERPEAGAPEGRESPPAA